MLKIGKMFSFLIISYGVILRSSISAIASSSPQYPIIIAFLHNDSNDHKNHHYSHHDQNHHSKGCFVTTTPQNHARGIRHWVNPCPHRKLRHMNPYHPPHHKLDY